MIQIRSLARALGTSLALMAAIPRTAGAQVPDSSGSIASKAAVIAPDSVVATRLVTVELDKGKRILAVRVEPWSGDFVRATKPDGTQDFVPRQKIRSIRDGEGRDQTRRVLDDWQVVEADSAATVAIRPSEKHDLHLVGRPLPESRWFLITQAGVLWRVDSGSSVDPDRGPCFAFDYGAVRNLNPEFGLGGNFYLGFNDSRTRFGVKLRARIWASRDVAIDLAPGILLTGVDDSSGWPDYPGFVTELGLSVGGWVQFVTQMESMRVMNDSGQWEDDLSWRAGARLGGAPGLAATLAGLMIGVAVATSDFAGAL